MCKKRGLVTAGLCCCVSMLGWAQHSEAGTGKVTICHKSDSVKYHQITVSTQALPAHLAHGDCVVDDGKPCTVDSCDSKLGCIHAPHNGLCDDGNACTIDTCDPAARCVYSPITCDDGNACTDDTCDPATSCVYTDSLTCGDGVVCAPEQCESDADCSAGFFCDACACTPEPSPECDGATCATYIPCNLGSRCLQPVCATTDTGGVCLEGATPCAGLPDCTTSADCPGDGLCAVGTCCDRNVCVDPLIFCLTISTSVVPTAPVKTIGSTISQGAD